MPQTTKPMKRARHACDVATSVLKVRITEALKSRLVDTSERAGMTLSAFTIRALRLECDRQAGYPKSRVPFFIDPKDVAQNPIIKEESEE